MFTRILFFTLLILNLALFIWEYQRAVPEWIVPSTHLPPLTGPSIQLLSETTPYNTPSSHEPSGANPHPKIIGIKSQQHCVSIGPLEQQATVIDIIDTLERAGHTTNLRTKTEQHTNGFWVVAKAKRGQKKSALMSKLHESGVLDVWRFKSGPLAGMLSLGFYSDRASAKKRIRTLAKKRFRASIRPRKIEITKYWIYSSYMSSDTVAKSAIEQIYKRLPELAFPPPSC